MSLRKVLASGVADFLDQVAASLRGGAWQGDTAAEEVAEEFSRRAEENRSAAKPPGEGLSAILLCPEAHTEAGGVHTVEGSGPILQSIATNPSGPVIVQVKRRTQSKIAGIASYIAVNPQIPSWRLFLSDVRRALDDPGFQNRPDVPPGAERAADLILAEAERDFMKADESSADFLQTRVVNRTNAVLDRGVSDAYKSGKATIAAAMDRSNDGTPEGRNAALSSLDHHFGVTWNQFRRPLKV